MAGDTLTVRRVDPRTMKSETLGKFILRDGKVRETYEDSRFRQDIRHGVRVGPKRYRPSDGAAFMAALEKVYGASSFFSVERS